MFRTAWVVLGVMLGGLSARAEDDKARAAREEVERQLKLMVGTQPAKVRIDFEALDEPNFKLEAALFELDGKPLTSASLKTLEAGTHLVWNGEVLPGHHAVKAKVSYTNSSNPIFSEEGGSTWKVAGDVSFDVTAGIEVQVKVAPLRDASQKEISKRLRLSLPTRPVMLAKVDDSMLPEPPPKPVAVAAVVDAGPSTIETGEVAALVARAPKAAKPMLAERAPRAKAAAPPTPAPEPESPEPAAGELAPAPEPVAVAEVVDAGAAVAVTTPTAPEEPSIAWGGVGLGVGVLTLGAVILLARRRSNGSR